MTSAQHNNHDFIPITRPQLDHNETQAASEALASGWIMQGPQVHAFETEFCQLIKANHAVALSSGTAALHIAMMLAEIGPQHEVICPSLSYIATAHCIEYVGAKPVFAEVDKDYNLDPQDVARRINSKTRAILVVHQMGMPANLPVLQAMAKQNNLVLIEDAACATGSRYQGQWIGTHSDLVCFSFHPRKVMTTGDGGMLVVQHSQHADRARRLRQHGMTFNMGDKALSPQQQTMTQGADECSEVGYNYRMTDVQAAIGRQQLNKLPWMLTERRRLAAHYHQHLANFQYLRLPIEPADSQSNYQSYSIYVCPGAPVSRDQLRQALAKQNIASRPGIMTAHRTQIYQQRYGTQSLPISEDLSDRSLLIPLFVGMNEQQQERVIDTLTRKLQG